MDKSKQNHKSSKSIVSLRNQITNLKNAKTDFERKDDSLNAQLVEKNKLVTHQQIVIEKNKIDIDSLNQKLRQVEKRSREIITQERTNSYEQIQKAEKRASVTAQKSDATRSDFEDDRLSWNERQNECESAVEDAIQRGITLTLDLEVMRERNKKLDERVNAANEMERKARDELADRMKRQLDAESSELR